MKLFTRHKHTTLQPSPSEIQKMILLKLASALEPYGFKRDGNTFIHSGTELLNIINLQAGRWNTNEDAEYYVNLAIFYPPAFEIQWGDPAPQHPKEYIAQLRTKLHGKRGIDTWRFTRKIDPAQQADNLVATTLEYGLPYFDGIDTPLELAGWLMDGKKNESVSIASHVDRAIIFSLLGDQAHAQSELDTYIHKNKRIRDKTDTDPIAMSIRREYVRMAEKMGLSLEFPELVGERCVGFYLPMKGTTPVHDERRARSKLELFLRNLEKKGLGYTCHYGSSKKPGTSRLAFYTSNPTQVINYIETRKDKLALPLDIVVDDIL